MYVSVDTSYQYFITPYHAQRSIRLNSFGNNKLAALLQTGRPCGSFVSCVYVDGGAHVC